MNYQSDQCSRIYKTETLSKDKNCIFLNTAAVAILHFPLPRKQCCCVFKRKRRAVDLEIVLLRKVVCIYENTFSSSFVRDFRDGLITARLFCLLVLWAYNWETKPFNSQKWSACNFSL